MSAVNLSIISWFKIPLWLQKMVSSCRLFIHQHSENGLSRASSTEMCVKNLKSRITCD